MAKLRDRVRMSAAEVWALLEECRNLQVATLNRDGTPHLTTLWFAVVGGAIVFPSYTKSQKIVNLRRDPRIAVLAEAGSTYEQLRGVSINATAELVEAEEALHELNYQITKRYSPELSEHELRAEAERQSRKHTVVVVRPEKIASWDHRKLSPDA